MLTDWLGFCVLAGGALAAIMQWIVRPVYRSVRAVSQGVHYLTAEMQNNGGSTMRDAIDRIETNQGTFDVRLTEIETRLPSPQEGDTRP